MNHESLGGTGEQSDVDRLHQLQDICLNDPAFQPYPDGQYCGNDPELARPNNEFYQAKEERIDKLRAEIRELKAKIAEKPANQQ